MFRRTRILIDLMEPATKKLSVSAILFGILAGDSSALGADYFSAWLWDRPSTPHFSVSPFEGGAGYFAVAIALTRDARRYSKQIFSTLYWRGIRGTWLFVGLIAVLFLDRYYYDCQDLDFGMWLTVYVVKSMGPTPLLEFEVKPSGRRIHRRSA